MTRKRVPSDFRARFRLDAGPNGAQQERREMRVIGRLRCRIARSLRRLGAADRRRARGRRSDRRRERGDGCLRLRTGIATATVATRTSWFALPARLAASARAVA